MNDVIDWKINDAISLIHFELKTPQVTPEDDLEFTFTLQNTSGAPLPLDIRYRIVVADAKGTQTGRTFQLSNKICPVGFLLYNHSHSLSENPIFLTKSDLTAPAGLAFFPGTRTIPCVLHILVNGQILHSSDFQVRI